MGKKRRSSHRKRLKHSPPGAAPGIIHIPEDALQLKARVMMYSSEQLQESELASTTEIKQLTDANKDKILWIDIRGFGDKNFLEKIAEQFGIMRLQMEDVEIGRAHV